MNAGSNRLRLLYVGPFNSPHIEDLALAMHERGHVVHVGGQAWGGLPASSLPKHGVPASTRTFPSVLWMRRLLRDFQPDLVHAHWMPFAALAALAGARPLVATAWGSDVYGARGRRLLEIRLALRRASVATADSAHLLARLEQLGPASLTTTLVNWGVDLKTFHAPSAAERGDLKAHFRLGNGPVVLSPRGLKGIYNPGVVVAAFARVRATVPDAQLVLKHGRDEELHPEWSRKVGIFGVGPLEYNELAKLFRAAEVTVSIPRSDSSPRSVWEAMASGSAAVLSDLPWVHELIADGRDAVVVEAEPPAVSAAVEHLLRDEPKRQRIAASARKLVERNRDRAGELARLEACYQQLAHFSSSRV